MRLEDKISMLESVGFLFTLHCDLLWITHHVIHIKSLWSWWLLLTFINLLLVVIHVATVCSHQWYCTTIHNKIKSLKNKLTLKINDLNPNLNNVYLLFQRANVWIQCFLALLLWSNWESISIRRNPHVIKKLTKVTAFYFAFTIDNKLKHEKFPYHSECGQIGFVFSQSWAIRTVLKSWKCSW